MIITAIITAVLMEPLANVLHRHLWHGKLWFIHKSHHTDRKGLFESNDVFAFFYAAVSLTCIFFSTSDYIRGLGWGIAGFGLAYMFVHDGYIHDRFSCAFLGRFRYFRKLKAQHILHHRRDNHKPFGLFWIN